MIKFIGRTEEFDLGERRISVSLYAPAILNGARHAAYVHLHGDELDSIPAAANIIRDFGGRFWRLESGRSARLVSFSLYGDSREYTFDPNRIFTDKGCRATLEENGGSSEVAFSVLRSFAKKFLELTIPARLTSVVVAVHNNKGEDYSIQSYLPDGSLVGAAADSFFVQGSSPYNFFLTTDMGFFAKLVLARANVVLQNNLRVADDGSLSVYCGQCRIPYVNVEAQRGHLIEQIGMLKLLNREVLRP